MIVSASILTKNSKELEKMMQDSLAIYDQSLFYLRQAYFSWIKGNTEKCHTPNFFDLYKLVKETEAFESSDMDFGLKVSSIRWCAYNWINFIKSSIAYKKWPSKFLGKPKIPKYLYHSKKFNAVEVSFSRLGKKECKENEVRLPKSHYKIRIPEFINKDSIKCIKITKFYDKIKIIINYEDTKQEKVKSNAKTNLGIDVGVANLFSATANDQMLSWIIKGGKINSVNQYFNKKLAAFKSELMTKNKRWSSKRIEALYRKRSCIIDTYSHQVSRFIVNWCVENKISKIVIGKNKDWKQNVSLGKKTDQKFVGIPYDKFISKLKYKAEKANVEFEETEESYTSKTDHLAFEEMKSHEEFLGKRVKRGLFKSSVKNKLINADINGAVGILKKANALTDEQIMLLRDRGDVVSPKVFKV